VARYAGSVSAAVLSRRPRCPIGQIDGPPLVPAAGGCDSGRATRFSSLQLSASDREAPPRRRDVARRDVGARAQQVISLQRSAGNRAVAALLASASVQRVPWHDKDQSDSANLNGVPALAGLANPGQTIKFSVAGYEFEGHRYDLAPANGGTKTEALSAIAAAVGGTTFPASAKFLKRSQLVSIAAGKSLPLGALAPGKRNISKQGIDPFLVKAPATFNGGAVALYYQFGVDSYGYVVKVEQDNRLYSMHSARGQDELPAAQQARLQAGAAADPLYEMYSSAHHTDAPDERIGDTATLPTADPLPTAGADFVTGGMTVLGGKSKRLDAITKLAGEGARWQCVRLHAAHLRNSSRFYTQLPNDTRKAYITLDRLWGTWGTKFGSAFNIPNATVAQVVRANVGDPALIGTMTPQEAAAEAHFDLDH
jgi:hypothetical protein